MTEMFGEAWSPMSVPDLAPDDDDDDVSSDVPHLTSLAKRYMYNCLNSADAERSFSIYNLVFSDRRRRCSETKIKGFGVLVL